MAYLTSTSLRQMHFEQVFQLIPMLLKFGKHEFRDKSQNQRVLKFFLERMTREKEN
jgi:hypothetical protein